MHGRRELGAWGERVAADFLRQSGFAVLETNYRSRFGEIDLIAQDDRFVVFAEVKVRSDDRFALAREAVGPAKQERIRATALLWLSDTGYDRQPRFDVIEIYAPYGVKTRWPRVVHLENAF